MSSVPVVDTFRIDATNSANWERFANQIVLSFAKLGRQAKWNVQQHTGIPTPSAGGQIISNATTTAPASERIDTIITNILTSAESLDGYNEAYITSVENFLLDNFGTFDSESGWLKKPSDTDDDWIRASTFIRINNKSNVEDSRSLSLQNAYLEGKHFVELGKISVQQRVYGILYERNQYVDPLTGKRRYGELGLFGNVVIAPNDDFKFNLTTKLDWKPKENSPYFSSLLNVSNSGFQSAVGRFICIYIALGFVQAQDLSHSTSFYTGAPIPVKSLTFPSIGTFFIPRASGDSYAILEARRGGITKLKLERVTASSLLLPSTTSGGSTGGIIIPPPYNIETTSALSIVTIVFIIISIIVSIIGIVVIGFFVWKLRRPSYPLSRYSSSYR